MLQKKFISDSVELFQWDKQTKLLVAVSGGVDSVVLLHLLLAIPVDKRPQIGVAHVNHQLREESAIEAEMVRELCDKKDLPLETYVWKEGCSSQSNIEATARAIRYDFFSDVYKAGAYDGLVTAHHADDLAETVIMKLTKGTQLFNLAGIKPTTNRLGMQIYRPLLGFSKDELREYAHKKQLVYYEDQTNYSLDYYRNRIRHRVIPLLKEENPNFLNQVKNLSKQLSYTEKVLEETLEPVLANMVRRENESCWRLDLELFKAQPEEWRYLLLTMLIQKAMIQQDVPLSNRQLEAVLTLIHKKKSQGKLNLKEGWRFRKEYGFGYIEQVKAEADTEDKFVVKLIGPGEVSLSESEKVVMLQADKELDFTSLTPAQESLSLYLEPSDFPLTIRRREPGDAIIYNKEGNHKKLRRLFIDEKIPQSIREKMWVVANSEQEVLGVFTIGKSYLSIKKETDKIHYRLVYFKEEH